jgi:hypothetical protein
MTTLYFKTDSAPFNAAQQAASTSPTRKLLGSGGTSGNVTATEGGFTLDKCLAASCDGGANGDFSMTIKVTTAGDPEKYRPRLSRYNATGVLQATYEPTTMDAVVLPGFKTVPDTLTFNMPGVNLGAWQAGDIFVASVLFAQNAGGRRGVLDTFALDGSSFVIVPW